MEKTIKQLEIIQIELMRKRRDHNGNIIQHDDIDAIQTVIDILSNLIIEPNHIWQKSKQQK